MQPGQHTVKKLNVEDEVRDEEAAALSWLRPHRQTLSSTSSTAVLQRDGRAGWKLPSISSSISPINNVRA